MRRHPLVPILLLTLTTGLAGGASGQVPVPSPEPSLVPHSEPSPRPIVAPVAPSRPGDLGPWWRDSHLAAEIDLDDATVDELEQLFLDHRLRLADLAAELDRARAALDFTRNQTDRDEGKLRNAEDTLYEVRSRLQTARAELLVEMRARLDGEQWAQLESYRDRHRLPAPPAPVVVRPSRPAPLASPAPAPLAPQRPEAPRPEAPPRTEAPPRPPRPDDARPVLAPTPQEAPAPPAPAVAPSAPLPPAPPALSWWTDASVRSELRLDDEQVRALERTTREAVPRLQDLQRDVREAEEELSRLVSSQDLDRDAARRQVDHLAIARRVLLDAGRELEHRLLDVLTAEQRRQLDSI